MPQEQIIARYYPTLDTVITLDELPEFLNFLKTGLASIFEKVHYRDLQFSKSPYGDSAYYSLDIVSKKRLDIELPGADIFIVLNPEVDDSGISSFPITIQYQWPILEYIRSFNLNTFNFSIESYYNLALQILEIPNGQVLANAVNIFVTPNNNSPIEQLVTDINNYYGTSIVVDDDPNPIIQLLNDIPNATSQSIEIVIYQVYILNTNNEQETKEKLNAYFKALLPTENIQEYLKDLILPKFSATLELSAALEFPRNMLVPVDESTLEVIPEQGDTGYPRVSFNFGSAFFNVGTEEGINYELNFVLNQSQPAQIGKTGIIVFIQNLKLDLNQEENIPEADADGRPESFMGAYVGNVAVTLPKRWFNNIDNTTLQVVGRNLLVGTGGVSGTIALETVGGQPNNGAAYMDMKIGNWEVGFNHFDLTFKQNSVVESNIAARLKIPKLKDQNGNSIVYLTGHLNEEGDFNLTASYEGGVEFTLFNFVTFNFLTLELGRENDDFYIGASCQIWFENQIMAKLIGDQKIEIPRLRIYDNGTVEIVGGNGFIPLNISLNLGPIEMAVTGVHYGSTQLEYNGDMRKYNYWGFDGGISLDPLGIDVRGDGIKYYYTTDNDEYGDNGDSFIHIKTLEIDLVIPGTASPEAAIAIIHGMLSLPEPGESPEYVGEISLKLPKAKIAGGAAMKLQPKYPAFIVDAFIDLPAPIPIGPLGIYGFRGLLGYRYVAEKEAVGLTSDDRWYDYYTYPPRGIHVSKFSGPPRSLDYTAPVALGAGAVLGTSFDGGTTISARVMLVLSLPTLFMVDGRASILSARLGLDGTNEPPFFAFIAWGDNSIEMGMGADFQIPSSGLILDLYAEVQSGFFFDAPSAWYVNFGTKQDPVSARVLTIVTAQTYLMLSAQGIEAGARAEFDINKRFGPAKVHLYAYLEVGGFISFERPQIGGYIAAGGGIDIDIWIIGISMELKALFSAEAARPFLIYAEVRIRACVKIVFAKICKSFTIKLKWEKNNTVDRSPVSPLPNSRRSELVKGVHMLTNEAFELNDFTSPPSASQINKVIPLDTYIEFKTQKGLVPGAVSGKIGGYTFAPENTVDLIPPQKTVRGGREVRQVKHRYSIQDIEIKAWDGSSWQDYHPFEAVVDPDNRPNVADLRLGYWQIKEKQYDTIRLMATTPFTYMEAGEPGWHIPEQYGLGPSTLYCQETLKEEHCSNVLNKNVGQKYYPPTQYKGNFINGAYYTLTGYTGYEIINGNAVPVNNEYMEVTNAANVHGFSQSLSFQNSNGLIIYLPEASVKIKLFLTTLAQGVTIKYYRSIINDNISLVQYELVHQEYKTASQLNSVVEYLNENKPITKVVIEPDNPNALAIQAIEEQIDQLFAITYEEASGIVNITEPNDRERYYQLLAELDKLKSAGCTEEKGDCQKDERLCELYNQLLALFESCFIYPVTEKEIELLLRQQDCFNQFHSIIVDFDKANPDYRLIESMRELYVRFEELLNKLNELMSRYPEGVSASEVIAAYYEFRETTIQVLDFIKERGQCDCDDSPQLRCTTSLQQICWLSLEDHQWNQTVPGTAAIEEDFEAMTDAVQKEAQPIWRPNTFYYVKYTLKDEVDNGDSSPGNYDFYYGFKTVGPIGHYHKNPASGYLPPGAKPEEYPLTSLRSYIDYNRSYPNANGNLLKSKPLFYGNEQCRISLYFNKPLTEHMFQKWYAYLNMPEMDGQLHIAIKDPVTDVVVPYPLPVDYDENTVPVPNQAGYLWKADTNPILPPHIEAINNMIENADLPCELDLGNPIKPNSTYFTITLTNLKPQKLYTALFYNAFEKTANNVVSEPVHEYVFQTSRYLNFTEQVNSYIIEDEETATQKQAVFDVPVELAAAAIQKAYDIVANPGGQTNDYPLANQYQDLFDRIIEGVWEMLPADPPVRTEFIKIINSNTGKVIAILVRNPEPFNNPKIPLSEAEGMIAVLFGTGSVNNAYKVLYSNDYSQAIIMHSSLEITASQLNFRFRYLNWNGNEYVIEDTVQVENININD